MFPEKNTLRLYGGRAVVFREGYQNIEDSPVDGRHHMAVWRGQITSVVYIMVQGMIQQQKVNM
uniref:Uncharacterized protein n=1 Tax=Lotus japonicus TaxID=34305 RepID=I3RZC3_LOTJA|nr:unknown [Lotus japonicus]